MFSYRDYITYIILGCIFVLVVPANSMALDAHQEFQVNSTTDGIQPQVAMDAQGNYVIAWQSQGQEDSSKSVYARRYDAAGNPLGSEFLIGEGASPSIAMNAQGYFILVWQKEESTGNHIYAQMYQPSGQVSEPNFRVNTTTNAVSPTVAINEEGRYVIAWYDSVAHNIYARIYDPLTGPLGPEFQIENTLYNYGLQVAMDAQGNFVVVWGGGGMIYAQRFDFEGIPLGSSFPVNFTDHFSSFNATGPDVAMNSQGAFVVVWSIFSYSSYVEGILAQRFDANGTPRGEELVVIYTNSSQSNPAVAMDDKENFTVVWRYHSTDYIPGNHFFDISARSFDAETLLLGEQFFVNFDSNLDYNPAIALNNDGKCIIAWDNRSDIFHWRNQGNMPPRFNTLPEMVVIGEDLTGTIYCAVVDPNGDSISMTKDSSNTHLLPLENIFLEPYQSPLTLIPAPDQYGEALITFTADDGTYTTTRYLKVIVTNRPDDIVAYDDTAVTEEGQPVDIDVLANDIDPDRLILEIAALSEPAHGSLSLNDSRTLVTYTPNTDFTGTDSFTYTVSNGFSFPAVGVVTVQVLPINHPPFLMGLETEVIAIMEDTPSGPIPFHAGDPDGDPISFTQSSSSPELFPQENILIEPRVPADDLGNYQINLIPAPDLVGTASITITVSDGILSAFGVLTLFVQGINDSPVANDDAVSTYVDTAVDIHVLENDTDIDSSNLWLEIFNYTNPAHGTLVNHWQFLTYTPNPGFVGTDTFTYTIHDGGGSTDTAIVTVTVIPAPAPLVCGPIVGLSTSPQPLGPNGVLVSSQVSFTDSPGQGPHHALWDWGNGATTFGEVTESTGDGTVSGQYNYTEPGLYPVALTLTNKNNVSCTSEFQYLVVIDPRSPLVAGHGLIVENDDLRPPRWDKMIFSLTTKHVTQQNQPLVWLAMKSKSFSFEGITCDWIVVNQEKIKLQGSGTLNGLGDYAFMLTAVDGRQTHPRKEDTLRIKVWVKDTDEVIYDNQPGVADHLYDGALLKQGDILILPHLR